MEILNVVVNIFLEQSEFWWLAFLFIFGWVWTVWADDADTVAADIINDLQDCKVDTDEVPILQNILGGSQFGTWSQSDANKGLSRPCTVDSGSVVPSPGELVTGAISGATGKVMWMDNQAGLWTVGDNTGTGDIYLGGCAGRFNDNENLNGSVSGANFCTVNMPAAGAGVDLVANGEFELGVASWNPVDGALASVAGGQVGNCLQITRTGGVFQIAYQQINFTIGKIYKITAWVKSGTSGNEAFLIHLRSNGVVYVEISGTSGAAWVKYEITWKATAASAFLVLRKDTATAGTMLFDEASLYEITPCCTAADNLAWDGDEWTKDTTLDLYREHWDGGTNTKEGSFYALKCVPSAVNDWINWRYDIYDYPEHLAKFLGRTVIIGMWVKTSTANHFRMGIYEQGGASVYSDYHTGGGAWEWIEVPYTFGTTATWLYMQWRHEQAPNVDGSTIVYLSQPMLIFCPATDGIIGEGNYTPRYQEKIELKAYISSNALNGLTGQGNIGATTLNIEADSDARLPKGCKAVWIWSDCQDSGSAANTCYLRLRGNATMGYYFYNSPEGLANDRASRESNKQPCDENGDMEYSVTASGAGNFDINYFRYHAVQVK